MEEAQERAHSRLKHAFKRERDAAALDGAYWTAMSITLPFHPVFSPPVAPRLNRRKLRGRSLVGRSVSSWAASVSSTP